MIEPIDSKNKDTELKINPLDVTSLGLMEERESIAYVIKVVPKYDINTKGWCVFTFKDTKNNVVTGTIFNLEDLIDQGIEVLKLNRKLVRIRYKVQDYQDRLVLRLSSVENYTGSMNKSLFVGKLENATEMLEEASVKISNLYGDELKFPKLFSSQSLGNVYNGIAGGFCKLISLATDELVTKLSCMIPEQRCVAALCFYKSILMYYNYLGFIENHGIITIDDKLKMINKVTPVTDAIDKYITDCNASIIGLSQPQTLYGYLITECIFGSEEWLNVATNYQTCIKGGVCRWMAKVQTTEGIKTLEKSCVRV